MKSSSVSHHSSEVVKAEATTAFMCVLALRPSEYRGDNDHVVSEEAAVDAARTLAEAEHFRKDLLSHSCCIWNKEAGTVVKL